MAIAFDAVSSGDLGGTNLAGPLTFSHTCTGSNRTLLVAVSTQYSGGANPTGVTYNGVSMTLIDTQPNTNPDIQTQLYYLANPASGANNISVSWSITPARCGAIGLSLTGTDTSPLGNTNKTNQDSTSLSLATTTGTANSWVVNVTEVGNSPEDLTATGTNQTDRLNFAVLSNYEMNWGTQTTTSAGSYTMSWTKSSSSQSALISAEIKELAGSTSPSISPSISPSRSPSISPSISPSVSPSQSPSASISPSISPSPSPSPSASISPSVSSSVSPSASISPSVSSSVSPSFSPSTSISPSLSPSQSPSASISPSISPSTSPSSSVSPSPSPGDWDNQAKNSASWVNGTRNTSSFSSSTKHTSTWYNVTKN